MIDREAKRTGLSFHLQQVNNVRFIYIILYRVPRPRTVNYTRYTSTRHNNIQHRLHAYPSCILIFKYYSI